MAGNFHLDRRAKNPRTASSKATRDDVISGGKQITDTVCARGVLSYAQ